jgi:HSP20 family protein
LADHALRPIDIGRRGANAIEIHDPDTISCNQRQAVRHVTRSGRRMTSRVVGGVNSRKGATTMFESMRGFPSSLFGELDRLQRELDDMFGFSGRPASIRSVAPGSYPAINIGNTPTSVEIYAFAPGIDASKVEITLDRGVLTLSGERPNDLPETNDKVSVYSRERLGGSFRRAVSLPDDVDPEHVNATYRDGVLRISLPRHESAQPKRIAIQ